MNQRTADSGQDFATCPAPLTAREAAAALGLHERTIRRAIRRGELFATKWGGVFRIDPDELERFRDTRRSETSYAAPLLKLVPPMPPEPLAQGVPAPPTPLIGREREVAAIQALLWVPDGPRLVALTGPGGVGKTRLALAVAATAGKTFADGVAFVSLASIRDPALVAAAIAKALGVREARDRSLAEQISASLVDKRLLLVLDNFEQVVAAGPLISELLAACPRLNVLVTSRARLRLRGEHDVPISPLAIPEASDRISVRDVARADGVRLLVARARAVDPDFTLTEENAGAVAAVCRRLEGLPLAIELAAARIAVLPPDALVARLDRRLPLLTGGPRDLPPRLQTMRDAISWSYELLSSEEQALFRRLAVFVGGFTLKTAERVSGGSFQEIASLVDNSLLRRAAGTRGEPRFEMLETIREFGLEQLQACGELDKLSQRHAEFFLSFAEDAARKLRGRQQVVQLARLEAEHDNLRAALTWSLTAAASAEMALRLVAALHGFWYLRGHFSEGRRWLEAALERAATDEPSSARVTALRSAEVLVALHDDSATGRTRLRQSIALGRALRNAAGVACALDSLGMGDLFQVDPGDLRPLVEESVAIFREAEDQWGLAMSLCTLGIVAIASSRPESAVTPMAEGLALARVVGDPWGLARALHYAGELARLRGDDDEARALYEESLSLYRELDHWGMAAIMLHNLGYIAQRQGTPRQALTWFAEALAEHIAQGDLQNIGSCLGGIAGMAAVLGRPAQAARLFGAAESLFERLGTMIWPVDKVDYDRNLATVQAGLGKDAFAAAFAAGRSLSLEQALAEATAVRGNLSTTSEAVEAGRDFGLTSRELEILRLVARHATDRQIADTLSVSPRTVMHHVSHILAKLGVSNRRDAATLAARLRLI